MKKFTDFLQKHEKFIKKLIIFFVAYLTISIVKSPELTNIFRMMFGDFLTTGIEATATTFIVATEV